MLEELPLVGSQPEPDDFILYPERHGRQARARGVSKTPNERAHTLQRWWYRHLEAAGLVGAGMTSGLNVHRARHTFAKNYAGSRT